MTFLKNPKKIPSVRDARAFFQSLPKDQRVDNLGVTCGPALGWRTQSKLAVRRAEKEGEPPAIGLFLPGTHDVIRSRNCAAHHPSINKAIQIIEEVCLQENVVGYSAQADDGDLRYVQLTVERSSGKVQLLLVWHADKVTKALRNFAEKLAVHE